MIGLRVEARDRRAVAIHEAGHAVVLRHFNIRWLEAAIYRADGPASPDHTLWRGMTKVLGDHRVLRLSRLRQAMCGVAGRVAEEVWRRRHDAAELRSLWWGDVHVDPNCMSDSDWSLLGCEPGEPSRRAAAACDAVAELLEPNAGPLWRPLLVTARTLMREGAVRFLPPIPKDA